MTFAEALGELGLTSGAAPEAIRAAYLKLLRVRKPDRDPEGFRRLREAYERIQSPDEEDDEQPGEVFAAFPVRDTRSALKRELDRIGDDPLRLLQRIQVLDIAFSRAHGDEDVVMLLLEELVIADMLDSVLEILTAHRPATSVRPWEWALRMLPKLEADRLARTAGDIDPELQLRVALLLLAHRKDATATARRVANFGVRGLQVSRAEQSDAWAQLESAQELLPIELWLSLCIALLEPTEDTRRSFERLPEWDIALIGETLRTRAPAVFAALKGQLPVGAASNVPGPADEELMVRYLRLQLTLPDGRREKLRELAKRRPADLEFTRRLVEEMFAAGELNEIASLLAPHAVATQYDAEASPVWAWALERCVELLKLKEPAPEVSTPWLRVMMSWALAASGRDADEAARMLHAIVTSTPEAELLAARQLVIVAVLEACARSMSTERARLLEWLWFFLHESDLEFIEGHDRQVLSRTMDTAVSGLREALISTRFIPSERVAALGHRALLSLRDQVLRENPTLSPRKPSWFSGFSSPAGRFVSVLGWMAALGLGLLVFWVVVFVILQIVGGWGLGVALVAGTIYGMTRSKKS